MARGPAGSFFNKVPEDKPDDNNDENEEEPQLPMSSDFAFEKLTTLKVTSSTSPTTSGKGFAKAVSSMMKKSYTAIGPPDRRVNDVTRPEYDKDGYTLYEDEETGEKSRVFEALVDYPCDFTLKIVGANKKGFIEDMVQTVADSCRVAPDDIPFSTKVNGKWTSVTVKAPVESAEMLYMLYENIDKDPRVKFKF
jgi:putative lipoic acid-binding regulatory protein